MDESICAHVKKHYNLLIGKKTAEALKNELGSAFPTEEISSHVYGRDVVTGLPVNKKISSLLVHKAIHEYLNTIIDTMRTILERTPPEISSDIIDSGIYITGGCATIKNLGNLISKETELDVNICEDPSNTVIKGLGKMIEDSTYRILPTIVKGHGK